MLPARGATPSATRAFGTSRFQSTLPARGATRLSGMTAGVSLFQSTLPARGATGGDAGQHRHRHFNPRSPHGERRGAAQSCVPQRKISIHAPRTGSDHRGGQPHGANAPFQSTLPARGATIVASYRALGFEFQSTLPARGATSGSTQRTSEFSFQSTLPARGATATPHIRL